MKRSIPFKPHSEYIREVKKTLPKEAFIPDSGKLLYLSAYFILLIITYCLFRLTTSYICYFILCCVVTHCLSSIGFLSHELTHNAIIRKTKARYFLEVLSWGINLIPTTLWNKIHNQTHHTKTNTVKDPDRLYLTAEKNLSTSLYTKIFYPNKRSPKWNPMVAFHFIPYIFRNILGAFYSGSSKPAIVPFKPQYSVKQKVCIAIELIVIILLQTGIYYATGKKIIAFLFASPLSYLFTSAIFNTYIFTNHFLNRVDENSDPLLGTTTVKVPNIFNKLHFNFAYHTEHHLFPSMNSKYYPQLSKILRRKYPERYHYLTMATAWKKLWESEDFVYVEKNSLNDNMSTEERPEQKII